MFINDHSSSPKKQKISPSTTTFKGPYILSKLNGEKLSLQLKDTVQLIDKEVDLLTIKRFEQVIEQYWDSTLQSDEVKVQTPSSTEHDTNSSNLVTILGGSLPTPLKKCTRCTMLTTKSHNILSTRFCEKSRSSGQIVHIRVLNKRKIEADLSVVTNVLKRKHLFVYLNNKQTKVPPE